MGLLLMYCLQTSPRAIPEVHVTTSEVVGSCIPRMLGPLVDSNHWGGEGRGGGREGRMKGREGRENNDGMCI